MVLLKKAAVVGALIGASAGLLTNLELECGAETDAELFHCWTEKYQEDLVDSVVGETLEQRFDVFQQNLALIRKHNSNPSASWEMDVNRFAAHSWAEFAEERLSAPQDCSATHRRSDGAAQLEAAQAEDVPATMDWREQGVVTRVKDQGSCGSCWTFSTTGVVESHHAITNKVLVTLSEQQLVDCAGDFNNNGCDGGLPSQAMEYIRFRGGLEREASYPYNGRDGVCSFDASKVAARVADVVNITEGDEQGILSVVGTAGPVAIAYDCTNGFQFYHSGVYDGWFCGTKPSQVNHAVLAVGYGHDDRSGKDYWLVKNSWGSRFGEKGYFRIVRGKNKCGLADCASYPKMQKDAEAFLV